MHLWDGRGDVQVEIRVLRLWGIMLEVDDVAILAIEVFLAEVVDDRLTILLLLMRALMSVAIG